MSQVAHKISLEDFLAGKEIRFESIYKPIYCRCLFKINGYKHKALICFETGEIFIKGKLVRRAAVQ